MKKKKSISVSVVGHMRGESVCAGKGDGETRPGFGTGLVREIRSHDDIQKERSRQRTLMMIPAKETG